MLFRQKVWNVDEPYTDYKKVRLSTISNSHEKTASVGVEILNTLLDVVAKDVIDKESELAKSFERIVIMDSNNEISPSVRELIKGHDEAAQEYLAKLKKYGEPEV